MAGFLTVKVEGLKELNELFKQLPVELGQKTLRSSLAAAAQPLLEELRRRCPVEVIGNHPKGREGDLLRSLKVRFKRSPEPNKVQAFVGSNLYYARFVNDGTRSNYQGPGLYKYRRGAGMKGGIRATHFMQQAFAASKGKIVDTFVDQTGQKVQKALDKYARSRGK